MAQAKRKKRFFDVEMPIIRKETQMQAFEVSELEGRIISYDLTRFLKGKSAIMQFIVKTKGDEISLVPLQIKVLPYFLKRMVRKGTNYVEDSFSADCSDAKLIIKPFLVTRRKVSREIRKSLRNKAREELMNYAKGKKSADIFEDVVRGDIQKYLSSSLKKVYPLSLCEIRILKVENGK